MSAGPEREPAAGAGRVRVAPPPRLPARAVWIDGALRWGAEATLSVFDRGARDGEGLFETIRVYRGRPFLWERHLERLVLAAAELGFPVPTDPRALRAGLDEVLVAAGLADAAARVTVTRGVAGGRPTRCGTWIDAEPIAGRLWPGTRAGAARAVFSRRPFEPGPLGRYKTTSRLAWQLAREEARAARVDEALLITPGGEVLEGSASNLFVRRGAEVLTPPVAAGALPGITRAWVMAAAPACGLAAREARLARDDLWAAEEVFLTNSVQEIVPLAELDGRALATGSAARALLERYRAEAEPV